VGLVDDRMFARMWVESRQRGRGLSRRALRSELHRKGIPDLLIDEALDLVDPDDELATAREVAARKARSVVGLPRATQMRRLSAALARKGYGPGLSAQVVREALTDVEADADLAEGPPPTWD
jgi:regulatory protein